MQNELNSHERVSALVDGQLTGREFARSLDWLQDDEEARQTWDTYHVLGHALRSNDALSRRHDDVFMARLQQALKKENGRQLIAPAVVSLVEQLHPLANDASYTAKTESANEPFFNWKQVAGVALFAVVSLLGWQVSIGLDSSSESPRLVQKSVDQPNTKVQPSTIVAESQVMIRDPQLDAFLAAHKQFGGTSALQTPTGFLRNATFDGAAR